MFQKKKILFITREIVPFYYGGIGTLFRSVVNLLSANGHEVYLLTEKRTNFQRDVYDQHYNSSPIYFVEVISEDKYLDYSPTGGVVSTHKVAYAMAVARAFEEIEKTIRPDFVISADFGAEAYVLLLKKYLGYFSQTQFIIHLSGGLHEILEAYQGSNIGDISNELYEPKNKIIRIMEDSCLQLADKIISPTWNAWHQISRRLNLIDQEVDIIPNLTTPEFQEALQVRKNLEHSEKIILFAGRLDRLKGADIMLTLCLEYLKEVDSNLRVIFIGRDCFYKEYGSTFLEEWKPKIPPNVFDKIEFKGQLNHNEVLNYMAKASVCVFPSRFEVFGLVCLEAMLYGVPSIVSKNTGLAELLGDALSDYAFDFKKEKDRFFKSLQSILTDPERHMLIRMKVKKRANDIVNEGEAGYINLFENGWPKNNRRLSDKVILESMINILNETANINCYLSNDIDRLATFFKVDEANLKSIVQLGKSQQNSFLDRLKSVFH